MTYQHFRSYAFDLAAYSAAVQDGDDTVAAALPTQDVDQFVSYGLVDAFVEAHAGLDQKAAVCFASKCYDMMVDVLRFYRVSMELDYCHQNDLKVLSNPRYGKIVQFYQDETTIDPTFIEDFWRRPISGSFKDQLRVLKRRTLCAVDNARLPDHAMDMLFSNELLDGYLEHNQQPILELFPHHTFWPTKAQSYAKADGVAEKVFEVVQKSFADAVPADDGYRQKMLGAVRYLLRFHMRQSFADFDHVYNSKQFRPKHKTLIGGTPKYLGRLISALYQSEGCEVWRFSHGGERGLFDDYHWGICELTFATHYFMHGKGEADLVRGKLDDKRLAMIASAPEMTSFPSRRHQKILERSPNPHGHGTPQDIVYVCGSYLAEVGAHFPAFKIPDPKYFEWQIWLLDRLRESGHRVSVKMHPKGGIKQAEVLAAHCDNIITTPFDQAVFDRACYLFDFAGSAFMDALAMKHNVVLFDTNVRPLDPNGQTMLDRRVHRITCFEDDLGRMRAQVGDIDSAVERSLNNDPVGLAEDFVYVYFN